MSSKPPSPAPPIQSLEGIEVDGFKILNKIGGGAFSQVHLAQHIQTGNYCAAKIVNLSGMKPQEFTGIMREISVFMQVTHPNIVQMYRLSTYEEKLIFFIEYAEGGTLLSKVNAKKGLPENEVQRLFVQLFSALLHLHVCHFCVHRDLKLENILIDSEGNVKLTDFGLSGTFYCNTLHTFVGTAGYQPPEILAGNEYTEKCDVWSLGVCLFAALTSSLPFTPQNHNFRMLLDEATNIIYPPSFSPAVVDLLRKMLEVKPAQRPTLMQLQNHPWLRGLKQIGANVAPTPIVFYNVASIAAIAKFKRKPLKADPKILEKVVDYGVDPEIVTKHLADGLTTDETTIYFFCLCPLDHKPPPPQPMVIQKDSKITNASKHRRLELRKEGGAPLGSRQARSNSISIPAMRTNPTFATDGEEVTSKRYSRVLGLSDQVQKKRKPF